MFDYIRAACAVPSLKVADTEYNLTQLIKAFDEAVDENCDTVLFPELCITGYTCGDLFFDSALKKAACKALEAFVGHTKGKSTLAVVGLPLSYNGRLYDCTVAVCNGRIVGIVPKSYPLTSERRHFVGAELDTVEVELSSLGLKFTETVPFGADIIITHRGVRFGIEIGSDAFSPLSPASSLCLAGAEVILNPSARYAVVGQCKKDESILSAFASNAKCAYCYANAGTDESTTDYVFSGNTAIYRYGDYPRISGVLMEYNYSIYGYIDIGKIRADRAKTDFYTDCGLDSVFVSTGIPEDTLSKIELAYVSPAPFSYYNNIPENCEHIFAMQIAGLKKRMSVAGSKLVIGVSGGLDSTLALLVCAEALRELKKPSTDLIAVTMPCFGTTDRTYNNALKLIDALGATKMCVDIKDSCLQHFKDIGHDVDKHDVTYENAQARERTQVLMDIANEVGGFVVGTGDLSELVLGWCTYNADHMSMYGVNSGVPKTLVREVVKYLVEQNFFKEASDVLCDILDTPISPELLPPDEVGNIAQKTEDLVGPYELHDFFIYYVLRYGFSPAKVHFLACKAFENVYTSDYILKWLKVFYRRFFTQQFKRSCLPDGVKICDVGVSPRGDLVMPSDASYNIWLKELENL